MSTVKRLSMGDVEGMGFLAQAIIGQSVDKLALHLEVDFVRGSDDFDDYVGVAFALDDHLPFTIKHYKGHPSETVTLYLPQELRDVPTITSVIGEIMSGLNLDRGALVWQREDDPDL